MTTAEPLGLVITIFLCVLTAILIWDEIRSERRFQAWMQRNDQEQEKACK
ncbi:MAG TPA: hypothetical protein GYA08_24065 [Chloroflexi bacterium]|nr:hypothetical protein [Chloroflexota bacterium]